MAYFDHAAAEQQRKEKESYEELKKFLSEPKGGKLNKFFPALTHLNVMEHDMEKMRKRLQDYNNFFSTLRGLLPREHSVHDIIG